MHPCLRPLLLTLITVPAFALTPDDFTKSPELWTSEGKPRLAELQTQGFLWTSGSHDTLRAVKGGTIAGLQAGETLVRVDTTDGRATALEIILYSRGDNGDLTEKEFEAQLLKTRKSLDAATGVKPTEIKRSRRSSVRADALIWTDKNATWYLEWSKNQESRRPEFIRLELHPAAAAKKLIRDASEIGGNPAKKYTPAEHLETTPAGDKWIKDVPMVDQGAKGYCVVASTERVLRLYGLPTDEHELAQLADSSAAGGTNYAKLIEAFRKNSSRLRVRPQIILEWDRSFLESFANDMNNAARKARQPLMPTPRTNWNAFVELMPSMIKSPMRVDARKVNAAGVRQFERSIATAVDKGLPVLWGVTLGLAPETPALPQANGGHMRLIIGYNAKNHTIIYTDSWGKGHERKTMDADIAFAITDTMISLAP